MLGPYAFLLLKVICYLFIILSANRGKNLLYAYIRNNRKTKRANVKNVSRCSYRYSY